LGLHGVLITLVVQNVERKTGGSCWSWRTSGNAEAQLFVSYFRWYV